MADKLIGLIGPGIGPRLCVKRMKNAVARVRGLVDGAVAADVEHKDGITTVTFEEDGDISLPAGDWLTFRHLNGKSVNLLCSVIGS